MLSENSRDQLHKLSNTPHSETKRRRNWLSIFENVSYMRKIKPVLEISLEFKLPIRIVEIKFLAVINHSKNAASLTSFSQTITVGSEDHWSESIPTKSVVLDRNRSALRRDRSRESFHQAKRTNVYRFWWEETVWIGSVMTRTVRIEQERERALAIYWSVTILTGKNEGAGLRLVSVLTYFVILRTILTLQTIFLKLFCKK